MSLKELMMFGLGSNTSKVLDPYQSNTAAAYSTNKVFSNATLCLRVRRASDNTQLDIGFVNNKLDTTSLSSFLTATTGFLATWYDQSGNGYHLIQADVTKQPGVTLNASNGLPAITFDGVNDTMANVANVFNSSFNRSFSNVILGSKTAGSAFGIATQTPGFYYGRFTNGGLQRFGTTGIATGGNNMDYHALYDNVNNLFTSIFTYDGTNRKAYANNTLYSSILSNGGSDNMSLTSNITVGSAFDGSSPWTGNVYTCLYLKTALSAADSTIFGNKLKIDFGLQAKSFVKFTGNSRVLGFGSTTGDGSYPGQSFPSQLVLSSGGPISFTFMNDALNGASSEALITTNAAKNIYDTNGYCAKLIVIFQEIIDSLIIGDTAAQAITAQNTYMASFKALGYTVVVLTCAAGQINISDPTAPNGNGVSTNSMEVQRLIANAAMPAYVGIYYDYLVDIGSDSRVGTLASTNNMTYWNTDKLHNNDTGYSVVAALVKPIFTSLLGL